MLFITPYNTSVTNKSKTTKLTLYTCLQFFPWSLSLFQTMLIISEKATTLYVRSAISDIRELEGPHGSLEVASLTWRKYKIKFNELCSASEYSAMQNETVNYMQLLHFKQ